MKNQHSKKNTKTNQLTITCERCLNKAFSTKKALQLHQMRIHNNNNTLIIDDNDESNR